MAYDVSTELAAGRTRLRKVAKICEGFGQRVQKSVFECVLSEMQLVQLEHRLRGVIDAELVVSGSTGSANHAHATSACSGATLTWTFANLSCSDDRCADVWRWARV